MTQEKGSDQPRQNKWFIPRGGAASVSLHSVFIQLRQSVTNNMNYYLNIKCYNIAQPCLYLVSARKIRSDSFLNGTWLMTLFHKYDILKSLFSFLCLRGLMNENNLTVLVQLVNNGEWVATNTSSCILECPHQAPCFNSKNKQRHVGPVFWEFTLRFTSCLGPNP